MACSGVDRRPAKALIPVFGQNFSHTLTCVFAESLLASIGAARPPSVFLRTSDIRKCRYSRLVSNFDATRSEMEPIANSIVGRTT